MKTTEKDNKSTILILTSLLIVVSGMWLLQAGVMDRNVSPGFFTFEGVFYSGSVFFYVHPNALAAFFFMFIFVLSHVFIRLRLPDADPFLLPVVAILTGLGLIVMLRLSPDLAVARDEAIRFIINRMPDAHVAKSVDNFAQLGWRHLISIVLGVLVMIGSALIFTHRTISWLSSKKYLWVFCSVILVSATLQFGTLINGRRLWLFGFQTVELVKFFMILFMAGYIYEKGKGIAFFMQGSFRSWVSYSGPFIAMCFLILVPLYIQKDLGPTVLLFLTAITMLYFAGTRYVVTLFFVLLIICSASLFYETGYPPVVRERFDAFFDPFHNNEAMSRVLWAVSQGAIYGTGIGYGQPHRIPVVQSDFNFVAICEEMGFAGGLAVLLLFLLLIQRCFVITRREENLYKKTLVVGIAAMIALQMLIIVCGNVGMIPLTGITLPFMSYGGSSMLVNFFMAGILLKISGGHRRE
jgi:cell division protein FtsW (lipid II flippase)